MMTAMFFVNVFIILLNDNLAHMYHLGQQSSNY